MDRNYVAQLDCLLGGEKWIVLYPRMQRIDPTNNKGNERWFATQNQTTKHRTDQLQSVQRVAT